MESATRGRDTLPLTLAVAIYTGKGLRMTGGVFQEVYI